MQQAPNSEHTKETGAQQQAAQSPSSVPVLKVEVNSSNEVTKDAAPNPPSHPNTQPGQASQPSYFVQGQEYLPTGQYVNSEGSPAFTTVHTERVVHQTSTKKGKMASIMQYTKFTLCVLLLFLFGSVFANVYQSLTGDCSGLEEEVNRLESLNEELKAAVDELGKQNEAIESEVLRFSKYNEDLENSIDNLTSLNENLKERISGIQSLSETLSKVLNGTNQTFEEFQEGILENTAAIKREIANMENNNDILAHELKNLSDTVSLLVLQYEILLGSYNSSIISNNKLFMRIRGDVLKSAAASLSLVDDIKSVTSTEYDIILTRAIDVCFDDEDDSTQELTITDMRAQFPFAPIDGKNLTLEEIYATVDKILDFSRETMPQLFIKNEFDSNLV